MSCNGNDWISSSEEDSSDTSSMTGGSANFSNGSGSLTKSTLPSWPNLGKTGIPRMKKGEHNIEDTQSDDSEEILQHDAFELSEFLGSESSPLYSKFITRVESDAPPFLEQQTLECDEKEKTLENITCSIDRARVHLLDVQSILEGLPKTEKYIHSWYNIRSMASVEATRKITAFIQMGYKEISKSGWTKADLTWGKGYQPDPNQKYIRQPGHLSVRIFHYIGLGWPAPEAHQIWMRDISSPNNKASRLQELWMHLSPPCMLIFDCDRAAILRTYLTSQQSSQAWDEQVKKMMFALFACAQNEKLHIPSNLPQNLFTCILLSPDRAFTAVTGIPVKSSTSFNSILDLFAESIALDVLPMDISHRLFRTQTVVASLWRRFILAQRLMKRFGLHVQSIPDIIDMSEHPLWQHFDYAIMQIGKDDVIGSIQNQYLLHLNKVERPAKYVAAVAANLLHIEPRKVDVMKEIAKFMRKSPENCKVMGEIIWPKTLGDYSTAVRSDPETFKNWCIIISGLLLVRPSLSRLMSNVPQQDVLKVLANPDYDDECKILFTSVMSSIKYSQNQLSCYVNTNTISQMIPKLFDTHPRMRQWMVIYMHASIAKYQVDPKMNGPTNLHAYSTLLLYDNRHITRAFAVTILMCLMSQNYPDFNATLMKCAMKAAIDGSSAVRRTFLYCVARYVILANEKLDKDKSYPVDFFVRRNIIEYVENNTPEFPMLKQVLVAMQRDPVTEIREIATKILNNPQKSGYEQIIKNSGVSIYKLAHLALFSESLYPGGTIPVKYSPHLFTISELELFEVLDAHKSRITALRFDFKHENITSGSEDGTVIWGDFKWSIGNPITAIVHVCENVTAVADSTGVIHIVKAGCSTIIDSFRPSLDPPTGPTIMTAIPGTSTVFISQGCDILVWNLSALLPLAHITVQAPPVRMTAFNGHLFCALNNGIIVQIDASTYQILRENGVHSGRRVVDICERDGKLCTVLDTGAVYVWDHIDSPHETKGSEGEIAALSFHRSIDRGVRINADGVSLVTTTGRDPISLNYGSINRTTAVCCCVDAVHPMCAVGYADGRISVWRIPN